MSDTDSFIEEVSEEVRRDRLFALMKRYGWIAVALVLLIVGGAAYNEYRKATRMAQEQAMGDSIISALENDDTAERRAALEAITPENPGTAAIVALLKAQEATAADDREAAIAALQAISNSADTPLVYRQIATFKLLGLQAKTVDAATRRAGYQTLVGTNPQLRLLAQEQLALIDVEEGKAETAIEALQAIVSDEESTVGLRRRASQLIVALGGELSAPEENAEEAASE
ncbi:tetratricopeptide repeat protein [Lentibacter algarum]|uniref:tetratricopeptide repeat protein n=1 Tax=Lentibacter algarum TaxID=576131 RepID=UPI001C09389C|nr:tetratricopeptide repeat protein [Lentibacter algarum]